MPLSVLTATTRRTQQAAAGTGSMHMQRDRRVMICAVSGRTVTDETQRAGLAEQCSTLALVVGSVRGAGSRHHVERGSRIVANATGSTRSHAVTPLSVHFPAHP